MIDLEKDAALFKKQKAQEKEAADRAALRFYMGCSASGLLALSGGLARPEEIAEEAATYARALLRKELEGF
jgi:hypothetical protein